MKTAARRLLGLLPALWLSACGVEPPKCSDPQTSGLVLQLLSEQIGNMDGHAPAAVRSLLALELPVATSMDDKVKRLQCEAQLVVARDLRIKVGYASQLDDAKQHVFILQDIPAEQATPVRIAIAASLVQQATEAAIKAAPKTAGTADTPAIVGTWSGPLEGEGSMVVVAGASGYDDTLEVGAPGCSGQVEFTGAQVADGKMLLRRVEADQACEVEVNFQGSQARLQERGCSTFHGAACGFSGQLNKLP